MVLSNRSLTQNTDRFVLANIPYLFLCEHLNVKLSNHIAAVSAFPSSAHTYRLLIFKELFSASRHAFYRASLFQQIVLFVSSREMRLCGNFSFSSIFLFWLILITLVVPSHFSRPCFSLRFMSTAFCNARFQTGRALYQRFLKLGKRFSTKAFIPSFWSSVAKVL